MGGSCDTEDTPIERQVGLFALCYLSVRWSQSFDSEISKQQMTKKTVKAIFIV